MADKRSGLPFLLKPVLMRLKISQRQLAKRLGIKQTHVSRYYNDKYLPSWESACKIAQVLGVSIGVFRQNDPAAEAFFAEEGVSA